MNPDQAEFPPVSLIIPVYHSQATLAASLRSFRALDYPELQIIVVDSSRDEICQEIVQKDFPQIVYHHSRECLLPHAARNLGVTLAKHSWLLFSDPDIYAPEDWLLTLMAAQIRLGGAIVSGLACHGRKWFDWGVHLAKFDMVLPRPQARRAALGATAGLLCSRAVYEQVGGFRGDTMLGDTLFSWHAVAAGVTLTQAAASSASHHHVTTCRRFCRERYTRGQEFVRLLEELRPESPVLRVWRLLLTVSPLRWVKFTFHTLFQAGASGLGWRAVGCLPVICLGHASWLAGEARQMRRTFFH
ncbi:MAG TPA: glycosyltransferase [Acidobacteriota bacterium]